MTIDSICFFQESVYFKLCMMISDSVAELHRLMLVSAFCGISRVVFVLGQGLRIYFGYGFGMRRVANVF